MVFQAAAMLAVAVGAGGGADVPPECLEWLTDSHIPTRPVVGTWLLVRPELPKIDGRPDRRGVPPELRRQWAGVEHPLFVEPDAPADPWEALAPRQEDGRRKAKGGLSDEGLQLDSSVVVTDPGRDDGLPAVPHAWATNETLKVEMFGPFFLYGQFGATSDSTENQRLSMTGRTGVACKLVPWQKAEVLLRGGPVMRYADPSDPVPVEEQTRLALELRASTPLVGPLKVEYNGTALPALTSLERERINQDFRLAVQFNADTQVHVGTRYRWEGPFDATPLAERMQLYLGMTLKR
jgi:hypothetical protein